MKSEWYYFATETEALAYVKRFGGSRPDLTVSGPFKQQDRWAVRVSTWSLD